MMINKKEVGLRIKKVRLNKGYTLEEFGKLFYTSKNSVSGWEKGRSLPNKDRLKQISKIADITVNELLYGYDNQIFVEHNLMTKIKNIATEWNETTENVVNTLLKGVLA